jgi:hypothetical protein
VGKTVKKIVTVVQRFSVQGSRFKVQSSGFRVQGLAQFNISIAFLSPSQQS